MKDAEIHVCTMHMQSTKVIISGQKYVNSIGSLCSHRCLASDSIDNDQQSNYYDGFKNC